MRIQRHQRKVDPAVEDPAVKRAKQLYAKYQPAQSAAVVETVFRKPKAYANLHEYDGMQTIDHVPTAIGFNSFDSDDEEMEAKMKSRYDFMEQPEPEPEKETRQAEEENEATKKAGSEPQVEDLKNAVARLRKVSKPEARSSNPEEKVEEAPKQMPEEKPAEDEKEEIGNDRYGDLNTSAFSDDDSCPPMWKSFSEDGDEKLDKKASSDEAKRRRAAALVEAKRLRALNSVAVPEELTPFEEDMDIDPRLRPNTVANTVGSVSGASRKSRSTWHSKSSKSTKKTEINVTKTSAKKQKDPYSLVSNSIVASASQPQPPPKVAVKAMENKHYEDASYGSEGQSEMESKQSSMSTKPQAPVAQNLAAYVYEGLANLTSVNYWLGEEEQKEEKGIRRDESGDDSESTKTSKSSEKSLKLDLDKIQAKLTSKKSLSPMKKSRSSSGMVSEISIPTPELNNNQEVSIHDDISILGLDKRRSKKNMEDSENYVPQQTKQKGKARAFGKILGRKTKA
jgi:hypothetical protein